MTMTEVNSSYTDMTMIIEDVTSASPLAIGAGGGSSPNIRSWRKWILISVYVPFAFGLILNIITAAAYMKSSLLRKGKPVHHLIFNMNMSDTISCLACQPFLIFQYTDAGEKFIMGKKYTCIASLVGFFIAFDSTVLALLLITCERLFAIASPLQHMHKVTKGTCKIGILLMWTFLVMKNAVMFFWNSYVPNVPCIGMYVMTKNFIDYIYTTVLYGGMGSIACLNICLGIMVCFAKQKLPNAPDNATESARMSKKTTKDLKVVKIVFMAVFVLFISWMPNNTLGYIITEAIKNNKHPQMDILVSFHMTRGVTFVGTVANPLIYFWQNYQCRWAVFRLFGQTKALKSFGDRSSCYTNRSLSAGSVVTVCSDKFPVTSF